MTRIGGIVFKNFYGSMNLIKVRLKIVPVIKKIFGISDLTLTLRKKKQSIEKLFYHKKYTADDIINVLKNNGVKPGHPLMVHSAMGNLYNYEGTIDELIDKLIEFVGPKGTLCMPAYPKDKTNNNMVFDVRTTPSAAGILTETFRKRPGVKRSLNQLHSVCAIGKDADLITGDHHHSITCFDEHSPYYIIGQLGGYTTNIGLPKWFVGTGGHVCESLLFNKLDYFTKKFEIQKTFTYINWDGSEVKHTMNAESKQTYIRKKSTKIFDKYFDSTKFRRTKLSNIWIVSFEMKYLYERLTELAEEGITIYKKG